MTETTTRRRVVTWDDPSDSARPPAETSGLEFLHAVARGELSSAPMSRLLGIDLGAMEPGRAVLRVTPGEHHCCPLGLVHGGLVATLCDPALLIAVHSSLPAGTSSTMLDLSVRFAQPVTTQTGRLDCEAIVVHQGSHAIIAQAQVSDVAGKLYARATATFLLRGTPGALGDDPPSQLTTDGPGPSPAA